MPRTPWNDDDEPLDDEDLDDDEDGEDGEGDDDPFLPFTPEDMELFYDWEDDFPELDAFDEIPDFGDEDFYEGGK